MAENSKYNEHSVLILCKPGPQRDHFQKAMRMEGFQASFVSEPQSVTDNLASLKSATFLHDWNATEPSQGMNFQQRLGKSSEYIGLCRMVYTETVTPQLTALAADTGIRRVITYATPLIGLVMEIKMALAALKNLAGVQELLAKTQAGSPYPQAEIDAAVEQAYTEYGHDPVVKLEYGNLSLRRNKLSSAREIASELVATQPQNVRAMNLMARIMMKEGRMDEAIATLEQANMLSPFNTDRLVMLGDSFFKTGDTQKAGAYFSQALALDPNDRDAQKGQGQVKLSEGDINGALDLIRNSASEEEAVAFFNNAAVHAARSGDPQKANKLYLAAMQALRSDKYKPVIYFNIGMSFGRLGDSAEALRNFKRALKYDPNYGKAQRQIQRIEGGKK